MDRKLCIEEYRQVQLRLLRVTELCLYSMPVRKGKGLGEPPWGRSRGHGGHPEIGKVNGETCSPEPLFSPKLTQLSPGQAFYPSERQEEPVAAS